MICPLNKGMECGKGCAWFSEEAGRCSILDIADKLAYLAAMREPMEKLLQALQLRAETGIVEDDDV